MIFTVLKCGNRKLYFMYQILINWTYLQQRSDTGKELVRKTTTKKEWSNNKKGFSHMPIETTAVKIFIRDADGNQKVIERNLTQEKIELPKDLLQPGEQIEKVMMNGSEVPFSASQTNNQIVIQTENTGNLGNNGITQTGN